MLKTALLVLTLVIATLLGCQTAPQGASKSDLYRSYRDQQDAEWRAGRITFVERTYRVTEYGGKLYGTGSLRMEGVMYSRSLAPKVDNKTMTYDEFSYLVKRKENELLERMAAADARAKSLELQEQSVRNSNKPVECRSNFGTTRCERSDY